MLSNAEQRQPLVDVEGLRAQLWSDQCRPSLRWVRQQQKIRAIPFIKMGHRVFFDVEKVREAILTRHTVGSKSQKAEVFCKDAMKVKVAR